VDLGASSNYLLVATVAAIAAFVPLGILSSRIGRKKAVLFGILLMAVCYALAMSIREPSVLMYIIFALVGVGWASINVNSFPMVVEMSKAGDVGKYTGYYYTFSMAAQIVTPLLSGWLITKFGYNILFPYAVVFSLLSFVTMFFVRHGDNRPEAKTGLEAFEDLDT
jgi:MFS family permease